MSSYGELGSFDLKQCISCIAFSPSGEYFASGGLEQNLHVWNAQFEPLDKTILFQKQGHSLGITDIKFSNRGANVAVSSLDSIIKNWDIDTNGNIQIESQIMGNWKIQFYDRTIYAVGNLGRINLYDSVSGQKIQEYKTEEVFLNSIAFSGEKQVLATGNTLGAVFILSQDSQAPTKYQLHHKTVRQISFADDNSKLLTASDDFSVRVFDINSQSPISQFNGHKNAVTSVHANPVDKTFVTGSLDKLVKIWDLRSKAAVGTISYHTAPVWAAKFNNNGKVVVSGGESGILSVHTLK